MFVPLVDSMPKVVLVVVTAVESVSIDDAGTYFADDTASLIDAAGIPAFVVLVSFVLFYQFYCLNNLNFLNRYWHQYYQ